MRNASTAVRLAVAPHWRREVAQVTRTLSDAATRDATARLRVTSLSAALLRIARGNPAGVALLFSDASATRMHAALRAFAARSPQLRLWWNDAAEVLTLTGGRPDAARELHVTFFREAHDALVARGYTAAWVPYLFTRPTAAPSTPTEQCIFYAAEIDISDGCFAGVELMGADVSDVSQRCWDLAHDIVAGRTTSVAADRTLAAQFGKDADDRSAHRMAVWAMRNRFRYLLVKAVADTFGPRLQLYHHGWVELGFRAHASRLTVKQCIERYGRVRVSLDLGGKSSHASLYPRVADILSTAGGLVQYLPSGAAEPGTPVPEHRQATTLDALLAAIDRVLTSPTEQVRAENVEMLTRYRAARLDSGYRLIDAIADYCAASA